LLRLAATTVENRTVKAQVADLAKTVASLDREVAALRGVLADHEMIPPEPESATIPSLSAT
jgi:hypothetical protein